MSVCARCAANVKKLKCKLGGRKKPRGFLGLCRIIRIDFSIFELSSCSLSDNCHSNSRSSRSPVHLRQVGGRVFPLEAVRQLEEMMDLDAAVSPHLSETSLVAVCANPLLPQVFRPVCHTKGAGRVLSELGKNVRGCGLRRDTSFSDVKTAFWWIQATKWKWKEKGGSV